MREAILPSINYDREMILSAARRPLFCWNIGVGTEATARHVLKVLPKSRYKVVDFEISVPIPAFPSLSIACSTYSVEASAVFDNGMLNNIYVYLTHPSFTAYKKGKSRDSFERGFCLVSGLACLSNLTLGRVYLPGNLCLQRPH